MNCRRQLNLTSEELLQGVRGDARAAKQDLGCLSMWKLACRLTSQTYLIYWIRRKEHSRRLHCIWKCKKMTARVAQLRRSSYHQRAMQTLKKGLASVPMQKSRLTQIAAHQDQQRIRDHQLFWRKNQVKSLRRTRRLESQNSCPDLKLGATWTTQSEQDNSSTGLSKKRVKCLSG